MGSGIGSGSGIGGGIGSGAGSGIGSSPYSLNYNENRQGEQGSIGTSGSHDKPGSGLGGSGKGGSTLNLPAVSNNNVGILKSRGQGTSGGGGALGSSGS